MSRERNVQIEAIYPLSPMQQGLVFHNLAAPGMYVLQWHSSLHGAFDAVAFRRAWEAVVQRHPALRTLFVLDQGADPLQVVMKQVALPWQEEDWRGVAEPEQRRRLAAYHAEDLARGFDLGQAPLLRAALFRTHDEVHHFVWSIHHAIVDGWSGPVIRREVVALYESFVRGTPDALPPPAPYGSFIAWLKEQDPERAAAHWRERLQGFTAATPLPAPARRTPRDDDAIIGHHRFTLAPAATAGIRDLARGHQLTLNTMLLGAWAILLGRSSGETDVVFGATHSGRPPSLPGVESMVGLLISTLPVRARPEPGRALMPWLAGLQSDLVESRDYEYSSLVDVHACSAVPRGRPLFETLVVFENYPTDAPASGANLVWRREGHTDSSHYPLTLVVEVGDEIAMRLIYHRDLFDAATIECLSARFLLLLESIVANPDTRLSELAMLPAAERRQILEDWNDVSVAFPAESCLHEQFAARAARTPEAVAVVYEDEHLTYRALGERANQLAHLLRAQGVGPDVLVGLCLERSLDLVVGILGILKAGGAYVPLDLANPSERIALILEDTKVAVLVTEEPLLNRLPLHTATVVCLDRDRERLAEQPVHAPTSDAGPEHLAYVIYTSGSTGTPKGVLVEHGTVVRLFPATQDVYGFDETDVWTLFHSSAFDFSVWEMWGALLHGGRLVVVPYWVCRSPDDFHRLLSRERVTVVNQTPSAFRQLIDADARLDDEHPLALRHVIFGGEALDLQSLRPWFDRHCDETPRLANMYGITETTVHVTHRRITRRDLDDAPGSMIGRPIRDLQVYVLDEHREPAPIGAPGELYVGGAGVARGYLDRAELTAARFVPDPFRPEPGARLYRTGDVGRYMANGDLEYLGRNDEQVKIRGYRIEPGEIEAALATHPAVREAVVTAQPDPAGEPHLVASLVLASGDATVVDEIHAHVRTRLPAYMVPARFIVLDRLPLSPNGKVDRRALATPAPTVVAAAREFVTPQPGEEATVAAIWTETLGVERVGAHDDFFDLGGHSLKATQVITRIRTRLGVELPVESLFDHPTVAGITEQIRTLRSAGDAPSEIRPAPRDGDLPLSFAQQRLWFMTQLVPDSASYNVTRSVELRGDLDTAALASALGAIVARHEVLRTTFHDRDGEPVQRIHVGGDVDLTITQLGHLPPARRRTAAARLSAEEVRRPFDLTVAPLLRARLLCLDDRHHVLLLALHHIACDAWSLDVLGREIGLLYGAARHGGPSGLDALPVQYADFAAWQRAWLRGAALDAELEYWRGRLADLPPLELPTDHPRPSRQTFEGSIASARIPLTTADAVRALSRHAGVTPYMTTLAAFAVLLHRYTGQTDIVVGSPFANRGHAEIEGLIGCFLNMLVVRNDLDGDPTFTELLARVRSSTLADFAHQQVPFEKLVEALEPERDLSRNPLFQVFFSAQQKSDPTFRLEGVEASPLPFERGTTLFDLDAHVDLTPDGVAVDFVYNTTLFDAATVQTMVDGYRCLLDSAVRDPDRPISRLPLMADEARHRLVDTWRRTEPAPVAAATIHELIAAQCVQTPDAIAVVSGSETLTYASLAARSNRLARHLVDAGVGPETPVGLYVDRGPDMLVGLLGILAAGGAYVPLDPTHPADRRALILDDTGAPLVVTQDRLAPTLGAYGGRVVRLDADGPAIETHPDTATAMPVGARHLAYVIYTSGSTGGPKGVEIEHGAATSFLTAMARTPGLTASDVVLAVTALSFDIAVLELLLPLTVGARVVIASREDAADGVRLQRLLRDASVTVMQATPATWRLLRQSGWSGTPGLTMLCGGEALDRTLADRLLAGGGALWNMYGPTEATVWAAVAHLRPAPGPVDLGSAVAGTRLYLLDDRLEPVPPGLPGELCIGGAQVARGYRQRPALTADRFAPDPFAEAPGARLYRTGDRVRSRADGSLEFLGRIDDQVKIRGFRIEPGEIERCLETHPTVAQAVVVVRETGEADRQLVGCVVARNGHAPTAAELRVFLLGMLPEYMVPSGFVTLDQLPLTPSGKIDRRTLRTLRPTVAAAATRTPPRTPDEQAIARTFAEVLELDEVAVEDDFFALGGHSLLATRLVSRIRSTLGRELPLSVVFETPTVGALATRLAETHGNTTGSPVIARADRSGVLPLSFSQQRLWFLDQLGAGAAYNMSTAVRLRGTLDDEALARSLAAIIARHEVLRTRFVTVRGVPTQVVDPTIELPLFRTNLTDRDEAVRVEEARRLVREEEARPFDLARGPILRCVLLRLDADDHVVVLVVHHVACDAWSIQVLRRELAAHYRAFCAGETPDVPALPIQYADFAVWQRQWLRGATLDRQLDYWRERLGGDLPALRLPTDRPRPAVQTFRGAAHELPLPAPLTAALREASRRAGVTPAVLLLAAFKVLLSRYTGQRDVVVGTPIANRTRTEVEDLVGFFVNALVMRTDLGGDPDFREVLRRVRSVSLDAYDHQDLPFERLVDEIEPERDLGQNPLFQVVFAMQNVPVEALELPGCTIELFERGITSTRFDLELHVFDRPETFVGRLIYNRDLFDAPTIARLGRYLETLLARVVKSPDTPLWTLPLMDDEERDRVLQDARGPAAAYSDRVCVHQLVERRAAAAPDRPAVIYHDQQLTYDELNTRANQLAHTLRTMGVGTGDLVGLCIERSPEMIVGWLAILKAGAAYVPLDPAYPRERLTFMLEDSAAPVLLTQERLLDGLPEHGAQVLCVDRDRELIAGASTDDPPCRAGPDDLAYMIYTSGSTGRPKGAVLAHRGLVNLSEEQARVFGVDETSRVLQFSSLSFDASTFEIVMALPKGAALVLGSPDALRPGPELHAFLLQHEISIVTLPPTALAAVPAADLPALRTITVAGEACPPQLAARWAPGRSFFNLYGPTETTIWATTARLQGDEARVPIGRPIANTQVYVLDERGCPVPVGVPGEMCIGGVGLARGYHRRPQLTAQRFVAGGAGPGTRLYRTGDVARYRPDGQLEFLGRADHQVKLNGFRIELGEIEAVVGRHPAVRKSVALIREDVPGDRRLVTYVVENAAAEPAAVGAWQQDHVGQWQTLYEQTYGQADPSEAQTFNTSGWNSSYTGDALPDDEMREWVDRAVARIPAEPSARVLELGCGLGLLLFRIAPRCAEYYGTDFSAAALEYVRRQVAASDALPARVTLQQRNADDLYGIEPDHFDTVVVNSVVQYFPSVEYLVRVIEGAVAACRRGGRIFIGDVRSLTLLRTFHASVQVHQAAADVPVSRLRQRVNQHMNQDQELVLDPGFFLALPTHLPRIGRVRIEPKRGKYDNELSRYRYDVTLELDTTAPGPAPGAARRLDWNEAGLSPASLETLLRDEKPPRLLVTAVPNRRIAIDATTVALLDGEEPPETTEELRAAAQVAAATRDGLDPEGLWDLADRHGYALHVSWAAGRPDGSLDAAFCRDGSDPAALEAVAAPGSTAAWSRYANRPLRGRRLRSLVPHLRQHAGEHLPDYMVPATFVLLDEFPLTPNGKIDRQALPAPDSARPELSGAYERPRTPVEETLARVWTETLGVERVGIHDNFFQLGGDSILTIQLVAAAREAGVCFAARELFQHQTIADLASVAQTSTGAAAAAPQEAVTGDVPLTPIQRWFFAQELAEPAHFNQALFLESAQRLDAGQIEHAITALVEQHDALRGRFRRDDGGWRQELVAPDGTVPVETMDLRDAAPSDRAGLVEAAATRLQTGLDLEHGPLLRVMLFRGGVDQPDALLVVAHHLAVDGVSWRILIADLERALRRLSAGDPVRLPPKTTSIKQWSERLVDLARSPDLAERIAYWLDRPWHLAPALPTDRPGGDNTVASVAHTSIALDADRTRVLLHDVPAVYHTRIDDVLLTAFVETLAPWCGGAPVLLDLEGHGRHGLDGIDLSRTVGWFTSIYPVLLETEGDGDLGASLRSVKEQLRAIPDHGLAYGLARHLVEDEGLARLLREAPRPDVAFNYLGQLDQGRGGTPLLTIAPAPLGPARSPRGRRLHLLEVNSRVLNGALRFTWTYSRNVHRPETIARLAEAYLENLLGIIDHCTSTEAGGFTPSDSDEFGWSQDELDDILAEADE